LDTQGRGGVRPPRLAEDNSTSLGGCGAWMGEGPRRGATTPLHGSGAWGRGEHHAVYALGGRDPNGTALRGQ
jgi:hypothetical protein